MPKVSVIIPVFNTEKYLRECLDSIVNQSLQDIEIICVNDGSTDNSLAILNDYAANDTRIIVLSQENKGQSAARNAGLAIANGEYVYFMDADDILELTAFEQLFHTAQQNDLDIVYFDADAFFETEDVKRKNTNYIGYYVRRGEYLGVRTGLELLAAMEAHDDYKPSPCLQFIKTEHLHNNHINFYEGIIHEDNLFSFLCIVPAQRVMHINDVFFHRRVRENSTMTKVKSAKNVIGYFICYVEMQQYCLKHHLEHPTLQKVVSEVLKNSRNDYESISAAERKRIVWPKSSDYAVMFDMLVKRQRIKNKIGNMIIYIPRRVERVLQYYRTHGLFGTLQKIKQKLFKQS